MDFGCCEVSWESRVLIPLHVGLLKSQCSFGVIEVNKDKSEIGQPVMLCVG
jgi:hypothetical protein